MLPSRGKGLQESGKGEAAVKVEDFVLLELGRELSGVCVKSRSRLLLVDDFEAPADLQSPGSKAQTQVLGNSGGPTQALVYAMQMDA